MLGFWGEWHTSPRTALFASPAVQQRVLDAYHRAFPDKILVARYPGNTVTGKPSWIGYHDDYFPEDTDGPEAWKFLPALRQARRTENWKSAVFGAEMVPKAAAKYLGPEWKTTLTRARQMHLSWVGPYCPANETQLSPELLERGRQLVRQMGYEFRLTRAAWQVRQNRQLFLHLEGINQGIAPFYYPWPLEVALLDDNDRVLPTPQRTSVDIRRYLPEPFSVEVSVPLPSAFDRRRAVRLAIGIQDPWSQKPRVRFANRLDVVNGWTVLGPLLPT